ncbi:MAG: CsbD family protein [Pseudonocardiaceae bacterium]
MSLQDKIVNKGQVLKGKAKEAVGKVTNDPQLEVDGKLDQGKGRLKQAGENAKDAVKNILGK